jgi:hypothetical protein
MFIYVILVPLSEGVIEEFARQERLQICGHEPGS